MIEKMQYILKLLIFARIYNGKNPPLQAFFGDQKISQKGNGLIFPRRADDPQFLVILPKLFHFQCNDDTAMTLKLQFRK